MPSTVVTHRSSKLKNHLVDVTPDPVLTRLEGLDNGVVGGVKMPGGVLILRRVTATNMSTRETEAQVHPGVTCFQTIFAPIGARRDFVYLVQVATLFCHLLMLSFLVLQWRRMRLHSHLACLCVLLLRSPHFLLGHPAAGVAVGRLQEAEDDVYFVLVARA